MFRSKDLCNTTEVAMDFSITIQLGVIEHVLTRRDISKGQVMTNRRIAIRFYVVHGEKPEIIEPMWFLANQKNQIVMKYVLLKET